MSDEHNLELLFATTGGLPYRPATYTCITEFTNSFPKKKADAFVSPLHDTEPAYQPEAPYPRIYTKSYRKSILSTLKQTIGKT
jgi:hypothetical protein